MNCFIVYNLHRGHGGQVGKALIPTYSVSKINGFGNLISNLFRTKMG